jgi:hypothetical protein
MKFFAINPVSMTAVAQATPEADTPTIVVHKHEELEQFANADLLKLFNNLTGQDVKRFADRKSAMARTWVVLQALNIPEADPKPTPQPTSLRPSLDDPRVTNKGTNKGPGGRVYPEKPTPCRKGTKQSIIVDMTSRDCGATMEELIVATNWNRQTVLSGLGWDMRLHGYKTVRDDQDRYHLVVPEGCTIPPHTPLKKAM